jgi:adenylate cyclase
MALEMRHAIGALTEKWRQLGHEIGFGIGIADGYATLGTIGFEGRFDYAAIGTVSIETPEKSLYGARRAAAPPR